MGILGGRSWGSRSRKVSAFCFLKLLLACLLPFLMCREDVVAVDCVVYYIGAEDGGLGQLLYIVDSML